VWLQDQRSVLAGSCPPLTGNTFKITGTFKGKFKESDVSESAVHITKGYAALLRGALAASTSS